MSGARPNVLIVILNWNGADRTVEALKHALNQDYRPFTVLVIDNGSTDGRVDYLRRVARPLCHLLPLKTNLGFGGGMNVGLRWACRGGYDYAWLLNNDAYAPPACLPTLVEFMECHPAVAVATPRLLNRDGSEQHAGGKVVWSRAETQELTADQLAGPATWGTWLTGAALFVRVPLLRQTGWFDSRFFAYWEDVDLCTRVLRQGGDVRAVPAATCLHDVGESSGGAHSLFGQYLYIRNAWLFIRNHLPPSQRRVVFLRHAARYLEAAAELASGGQDHYAAVVLGALEAMIRGHYGRPARLEVSASLRRLLLWRPRQVCQFLRNAANRLERTHYRSRHGFTNLFLDESF